MPRQARVVVPGVAHHVTQRGNNRQDVFFVEDDRRVYLAYLKESAELHGLGVSAFCLMTNHIHLLATPETEESLSKALGRTHLMYAQYVHRLHGRLGHFWQNRFYSCALDEAHAHNAAAYIELNPVRAGLVGHAWEYAWSSASAHCGETGDPFGALALSEWFDRMPVSEWKATLETIASADGTVERLRMHTRTGRPLGDDAFLRMNGYCPHLPHLPRVVNQLNMSAHSVLRSPASSSKITIDALDRKRHPVMWENSVETRHATEDRPFRLSTAPPTTTRNGDASCTCRHIGKDDCTTLDFAVSAARTVDL